MLNKQGEAFKQRQQNRLSKALGPETSGGDKTPEHQQKYRFKTQNTHTEIELFLNLTTV